MRYKKYGLGSLFSSLGNFAKNNPQMLQQAAGLASGLAAKKSGNGQIDEMGKDTSTEQTKDMIKSGLNTAVSAIPGIGQVASLGTGLLDGVGNMIGGKGGEFVKSLNPINSTVNAVGSAIEGDWSAVAQATPVGMGLKALGVNFGETQAEKRLRELKRKQTQDAVNQFNKNNQGLNNAAYLSAKKGAKLFETGGVLPSFNSGKNVILKGVLHKENNKTGDKGVPVISCDTNKCEKVAEIEKEELVLTREKTAMLDTLINKAEMSKSTMDILAIGKYMYNEIVNNTIDNTKI